jgi:hypothetical protein
MALGDPIAGGVNVQVTLFFGLGDKGWTETYFMNVAGGTNPLVSAEVSAKRLVQQRNNYLPANVVCQSLRVSRVTVRGDSNIVFPPLDFLGPGNYVADSANPVLGWNVVLANDDFQVRDTRIYTGWAPDLVPFQPNGGIGIAPPPLVVSWVTGLTTILLDPYTVAGVTTTFCLRSFKRPPIAVPLVPIGGFGLDAQNRITFIASTGSFPITWVPGVNLKITVPRKRCLKGLNGQERIAVIGAGPTGFTKFTMDKKLCCGSDLLDGVSGTAYEIIDAFYPITKCVLGRQGKRDRGRAFFVARGRQSARCC